MKRAWLLRNQALRVLSKNYPDFDVIARPTVRFAREESSRIGGKYGPFNQFVRFVIGLERELQLI